MSSWRRKEEVASKHVLELGAGLGVTACAVLEYGGDIVTADYSALPLAHCRLNTLVNSGSATTRDVLQLASRRRGDRSVSSARSSARAFR